MALTIGLAAVFGSSLAWMVGACDDQEPPPVVADDAGVDDADGDVDSDDGSEDLLEDMVVDGELQAVSEEPPPGMTVFGFAASADALYAVGHTYLFRRGQDESTWTRLGAHLLAGRPSLDAVASLPSMTTVIPVGQEVWLSQAPALQSIYSPDGGTTWHAAPLAEGFDDNGDDDDFVECLSATADGRLFGQVNIVFDHNNTVLWDPEEGAWTPFMDDTQTFGCLEADIDSVVAVGDRLVRSRDFQGVFTTPLTDPAWEPADVDRAGILYPEASGGAWHVAFDDGELPSAVFHTQDGVEWASSPIEGIPATSLGLALVVPSFAQVGDAHYLVDIVPCAPVLELGEDGWERIDSLAAPCGERRQLTVLDGALVVGDAYGVSRRDDDAWQPVDEGLFEAEPVAVGDGLYVLRAGRVYRRDNPGDSWQWAALPGASATDWAGWGQPQLVAAGDGVAVHGRQSDAVWLSADAGETFRAVPQGDELTSVDALLLTGDNLWAAGEIDFTTPVLARLSLTDGDAEWVLHDDAPDAAIYDIVSGPGGFLAYGDWEGEDAVALAPDFDWVPTHTGRAQLETPVHFAAAEGDWWLVTVDEAVARSLKHSSDAGESWEPIDLEGVLNVLRYGTTWLVVQNTDEGFALRLLEGDVWRVVASQEGVPALSAVVSGGRVVVVTAEGWLAWE